MPKYHGGIVVIYKKIYWDSNIYLTDDSLIEKYSKITTLNNITLRKVNIKPYGFDRMYIGKDLIENKLYRIIVQFNGRNTPYF